MVGFLFHGIFNRLPIRDWVRSGVGIGIVALPALIFQYIPLLGQIQGMGGIVGNSIPSLGTILAIPSLVGIIPFLLGVGVLIWAAFHRKRKPRDWERVAALLVGGGVLGYGLAGFFPAFVFGGKMIYLAAIGVMLAATGGIFSGVSPIHLKKTGIILLVLILGIWATSSSATHFIYGSKATIAEARFAEWFGNREAGGSKVLFLSPGHGKMGEYAGMLPFDFKSTHYFSSLTFQTVSNEATLMLSQDAARFQETLANRCLSCVKEFDAAFIVVNTSVFPLLPDHVLLFEKDGFLVYRGQ
ncbi:MAG: hypothetical protein U1C71_00820 [archaeon]|nr:hypothetical protein [archaeon]